MSSLINTRVVCIVLYAMSEICRSQSCSIGNIPSIIDISGANTLGAVDNFPALLLSQATSLCNGTVKQWKFCHTIIHSTGTVASSPNKISIGVWRPTGADAYSLVKDSMVPLPPLETYFQLEFVCRKFSVAPVDIMEGDLVGLVLHDRPSVFGLPGTNDSGSEFVCGGTPVDESYRFVNQNCSWSRLGLFLQGLSGDDDSLHATQADTPGDENIIRSPPQLWVYIVFGALSLLLAASVFVIVVMIVQRCQQGKCNVMATRASHEKNNNIVAADITSFSRTCADERNGPCERSQVGEQCDKNTLSQTSLTFSYPPPASKAPLPPRESIICIDDISHQKPLEGNNAHEEQDGIEEKNRTSHSTFDGSQSSVTGGRYSDATGTGGHDDCSILNDNVFEAVANNDGSFPVPALLKLPSSREVSLEKKPSVIPRKSSKVRADTVEQDSANGRGKVKAKNRIHHYANVKSKFGRINSVPASTSSAPVYAELTPNKNRTRGLSDSTGTPPLSNSRGTSNLKRSSSGVVVSSSPSTHARKTSTLKLSNSLDNVLMNIAEVEETVQGETIPVDYLEPVNTCKNNA